MSLQEAIDQVYNELISMTAEEIREEIEKPIKNGVGDLLVDAGVDFFCFAK